MHVVACDWDGRNRGNGESADTTGSSAILVELTCVPMIATASGRYAPLIIKSLPARCANPERQAS